MDCGGDAAINGVPDCIEARHVDPDSVILLEDSGGE